MLWSVLLIAGCGGGTSTQEASGPPMDPNYSAKEDPAMKETGEYQP
jgi:hypothetical protein